MVAEKLARANWVLSAASVCVVTPVYRFPLTPDEELGLAAARRHLARYDRVIVAPRSLEVPSGFLQGETLVRFPDCYFTYPHGYNRLLLRRRFYERFAGSSFVLIYQLDCLALRDGLSEWVARGYDYVGAPWFMDARKNRMPQPNSVGNGGLSLRRVAAAVALLKQTIPRGAMFPKPPGNVPQPRGLEWFFWNVRRRVRQHLGMWTVEDELENFFENEDVFWSFIAPSLCGTWRSPGVREALDFAIEENPRLCVELNGGRAPFGVHAWTKFDRAFIESLQHTVP